MSGTNPSSGKFARADEINTAATRPKNVSPIRILCNGPFMGKRFPDSEIIEGKHG
jgi:hypothetical protein